MDLLLDMKSVLLQAELRIQVLPHSYQFPINNTAASYPTRSVASQPLTPSMPSLRMREEI